MQKEVKPMKKIPRNKFPFGSRHRKRGNSFSERPGKSIFELLLNIETRIRGKLKDQTARLGGQKRAAVVRVLVRPNPSYSSRYVE
jgi:hypothetical protein